MSEKTKTIQSEMPADAVRYYVPTGPSVTEFVEKRSRFIGHVWRVENEEEARSHMEEIRARHHDARHNCWCYLLRQGGVVRCSDDGEPQGTAGQPMLEVFRRAGVENVCCVVTRYFGGILLGAGGLTRAYTRAASDSLRAAGISVMSRFLEVSTVCAYSQFERIKLEVEAVGGILGEMEYSSEVCIHALLPEGQAEPFSARIIDMTAGNTVPQLVGQVFRAAPCTEKMNKL